MGMQPEDPEESGRWEALKLPARDDHQSEVRQMVWADEQPDLSGAVVANEDDTLILTFPNVLSMAMAQLIEDYFKTNLPRLKLILVSGASSAVVYKPNAVEAA